MAIAHLFKSHDKDLGGGFTVRRILPAAARQSVGPFLFFDHMGPVEAQPGSRHDVAVRNTREPRGPAGHARQRLGNRHLWRSQ